MTEYRFDQFAGFFRIGQVRSESFGPLGTDFLADRLNFLEVPSVNSDRTSCLGDGCSNRFTDSSRGTSDEERLAAKVVWHRDRKALE